MTASAASDSNVVDETLARQAQAALGSAIAGNVINPATGAVLGPSAGGRIAAGAANAIAGPVAVALQREKEAAALQRANIAAAARASGAGGDYTPERLRQRTIEAILKNPNEFNVYDEDGQVDPAKVQQQADILVRSMGSAMTTDQPSLTVVGVNPQTGQQIAKNPDGSGGYVDAATGKPI